MPIYPKEGTIVSDHPAGIVDAEWVTQEHRQRGARLSRFPPRARAAEKAQALGFRPARADVPLVAPLDAAHGVDPKEPQTTLEMPSIEAMDAMMKLWEKFQKP